MYQFEFSTTSKGKECITSKKGYVYTFKEK